MRCREHGDHLDADRRVVITGMGVVTVVGDDCHSYFEALVAGRVGDVLPAVEAARSSAREEAGWVMDVYLLRGGSR